MGNPCSLESLSQVLESPLCVPAGWIQIEILKDVGWHGSSAGYTAGSVLSIFWGPPYLISTLSASVTRNEASCLGWHSKEVAEPEFE